MSHGTIAVDNCCAAVSCLAHELTLARPERAVLCCLIAKTTISHPRGRLPG